MEKKKNVLLIAYYWPPSGGAGVHRWLRFSNYFQENNCNLTVFCPDDAAWPERDPELLKQVPKDIKVIRKKVFEPHKYLGKSTGTGFTEKGKQSIFKKFMVWVRGNLFIPDSRVFWIKPSVRFLTKYLKEHPEIDTIISSGPPHSAHVIGLKLKSNFGTRLKWVADFRDPWTQIDFYQNLNIGKRADKKQKRLEKECLQKADVVVTVSSACASDLEKIGQRKVEIITNGFIFPEFYGKSIELDKKFTISHFGTMPFARNPLVLWKALVLALKDLPSLSEHLSIRLIGVADYQVIESFKEHDLEQFVELLPLVPHAESIRLQRSTQILLLVANNTGNVKGILTGKFFEYLGAKRPILAIGSKDSDLERAVSATGSGQFSEFEAVQATKEFIITSYQSYLQNDLWNEPQNTHQYSSEFLAKRFIEIL